MVYSTSSDGTSWAAKITVTDWCKSDNFSVWFDGTYLHYASDTDYGTIFYRRGIPNADGTITWSAGQQGAISSGAMPKEPVVASDSDGYVWIGCTPTEPVSTIFHKSQYNDGTWGTSSVTLTDLPYGRPGIIPLTSGKMLALYLKYSPGWVALVAWNGSAWLDEIHTESLVSTTVYGFSAVAEGDDVHIVFVTDAGDIVYVKYTYSTNSLGSETIIASVGSSSAPVISRDTISGDLYVFWATATNIYYIKWNGVSWGSPVDWIYEGTNNIGTSSLTCFYQKYGGYIGLAYVLGPPYEYSNDIRFASIQSPGQRNFSSSITLSEHLVPGTPINLSMKFLLRYRPANLGYAWQRKTLYAAGRFWLFFSNGTNTYYRSSIDGTTWSADTSIGACPDGYHFSLCFAGGYVHTVQSSSGGAIYYRRGIPNSDGTVTWETARLVASGAASQLSVIVDSNGYPWVKKNNYSVYQNTAKDGSGTWTSRIPVTYGVSVSSFLIPLLSGRLMFFWLSSSGFGLNSKRWNGSLWDSVKYADDHSKSLYQVCAVSTNDDAVHLVFTRNVDGTNVDIRYTKWTADSWGSETTLESTYVDTKSTPIITKNGLDLHVFWTYGTSIYSKSYVAGSWGNTTLVASSETDLSEYDIHGDFESSVDNGSMSRIWLCGTATPYVLKFATTSSGGASKNLSEGFGPIRKNDSNVLSSNFTVRNVSSRDLSEKFAVQSAIADAKDFASSCTIRQSSSRNLSSSFVTQKESSTNLISSCTIKKTDAENLSEIFIIRNEYSNDLPEQFTVRNEGLKDLSGKFEIRNIGVEVLSESFIIKNEGSGDLSEEFAVRNEGSAVFSGNVIVEKSGFENLSGEITVQKKDAVDFSSNFMARGASTNILSSNFTIRKSSSISFSASVAVQKTSSSILAAVFAVRHSFSNGLQSNVVVRHLSSITISSSIIIRKASEINVASSFTIRKFFSKGLSSSTTARKGSYIELEGHFIIRKTSSSSSSSGFIVRAVGTDNFSTCFIVQNTDGRSLSSAIWVSLQMVTSDFSQNLDKLVVYEVGSASLSSSISPTLASANLSSGVIVKNQSGRNLSANFTVRKSLSQSLSSNFIPRPPKSEDLSEAFSCRNLSSRDLSETFSARNTAAQKLSASFTTRKSASAAASSSLTIIKAFHEELSSSTTVRTQTSKFLSASFTARNISSNAVPSSFTARESVSNALSTQVAIRNFASKDTTSSFTIRKAAFKDLASFFMIRKIASNDLACNVTLRKPASKVLPCRFAIRKPASTRLSGKIIVRKHSIAALRGSSTIRKRSSKALSCAFSARNKKTANLHSGFILRNMALANLHSTFDVSHLDRGTANISCKFSVILYWANLSCSFSYMRRVKYAELSTLRIVTGVLSVKER
jgi:hypothetical protein